LDFWVLDCGWHFVSRFYFGFWILDFGFGFVRDGGCDWNAGVPACMSAKHEKARAI
jgi:hypothetical protein